MTTPEFLCQAVRNAEREEPPVYGIGIGEVVNHVDNTGMARVQVSLPWLQGDQPWARVVSPSAGRNRGIYFIPQTGDEVVVAFNHEDPGDIYVLGSLWNTQDPPPAQQPNDATTKRTIVTPAGQTIEVDDGQQLMTITSAAGHTVKIGPDGVMVAAVSQPGSSMASIALDNQGNISLESETRITLNAPTITLEGTNVTVKGTATSTLEADGDCVVRGLRVQIN